MSDDHGLEAARSQFEKIAGLVLALQSADVFAREDAEGSPAPLRGVRDSGVGGLNGPDEPMEDDGSIAVDR